MDLEFQVFKIILKKVNRYLCYFSLNFGIMLWVQFCWMKCIYKNFLLCLDVFQFNYKVMCFLFQLLGLGVFSIVVESIIGIMDIVFFYFFESKNMEWQNVIKSVYYDDFIGMFFYKDFVSIFVNMYRIGYCCSFLQITVGKCRYYYLIKVFIVFYGFQKIFYFYKKKNIFS